MNDNQKVQRYNCDGCSKPIPSGQEAPRFTTDGVEIWNQLFCFSCKMHRGFEFSKPFFDPNLDLKKMKITEAPEFKRYIENKHFSKNTKELTKELEDDWQEKLKRVKKFGKRKVLEN